MKGTAWLALVVLVAGCQGAQTARQRPAYKPPAVPAGSECYRISTSLAFEVGSLPQVVALTPVRASHPANQGAYRVLPDLDPDLPGGQMPFAEWFPTGETTIRLVWSNGFYGVSLDLQRVGHRLVGTGKTQSDAGEDARDFSVTGEPTSCPA